MAVDSTWIDEAFLAIFADCFGAEVEYRAVEASGEPSREGLIYPRLGKAATCRVVLALWVQHHYAAIVRDASPLGSARSPAKPSELVSALLGGAAPPPTAAEQAPLGAAEAADLFLRTMARGAPPADPSNSMSLPPPPGRSGSPLASLTSRAEILALLHSADAPTPTVLVAMEFSGSLCYALERRGVVAISADWRPCERGGATLPRGRPGHLILHLAVAGHQRFPQLLSAAAR